MLLLRLSNMLRDTQAFQSSVEILLFHGTSTFYSDTFTYIRLAEPRARKKRDFGTGFYTTTNYWQALRYANTIADATERDPMIVCVSTSLGQLRSQQNTLIVDEYSESWMETIKQGRWGEPLRYDWIYGRCGDGKTIELQKRHDAGASIDELLHLATPSYATLTYHYDQLWFGTTEGIQILTIRSIIRPREGSAHAAVSMP